MEYTFEDVTDEHREATIDIFNYFVANSFAAYPEAPVGYDRFDRFRRLSEGYPAIVIKSPTGEIVGYGLMRAHIPVDSMKHTAELSYFILPEHTRKGVGDALLEYFEVESRKLGITTWLAHISSQNPRSLAFHKKQGFVECGRFKKVGHKHGQDFDVIWMQKFLDGPSD